MKRHSSCRLVGALAVISIVAGSCSSSSNAVEQQGASGSNRSADYVASKAPGEDVASAAGDDAQIPDQLAMVAATYPGDLVEEMVVAIGSMEPGQSVLAAMEPLDAGRTPDERDERTRNASGALVVLDTAALQACGNVEITLALAQEADDGALSHLVAAAEMVRTSELAWPDVWGDLFEDTVLRGTKTDLAPLVAFLSICVAGGYEL